MGDACTCSPAAAPQSQGLAVDPLWHGWALPGGMKQPPLARGSGVGWLCGVHRVGPSGGAGPASRVPTVGASAGRLGNRAAPASPSLLCGVLSGGMVALPCAQSPTAPALPDGIGPHWQGCRDLPGMCWLVFSSVGSAGTWVCPWGAASGPEAHDGVFAGLLFLWTGTYSGLSVCPDLDSVGYRFREKVSVETVLGENSAEMGLNP